MIRFIVLSIILCICIFSTSCVYIETSLGENKLYLILDGIDCDAVNVEVNIGKLKELTNCTYLYSHPSLRGGKTLLLGFLEIKKSSPKEYIDITFNSQDGSNSILKYQQLEKYKSLQKDSIDTYIIKISEIL